MHKRMRDRTEGAYVKKDPTAKGCCSWRWVRKDSKTADMEVFPYRLFYRATVFGGE